MLSKQAGGALLDDVEPAAMSAGALQRAMAALGPLDIIEPAIRARRRGRSAGAAVALCGGAVALDRTRRAMAAGRGGVGRGRARLYAEGRARNEIAAAPPHRHGMDLRVRRRVHATISAATAPATSTRPTRASSTIRWWTPNTAAFAWWRCKAISSCKAGWGGSSNRSCASDGRAMTIVSEVKLPDESFAFNESRRLPRIALTTSIAYAKGARHTLDVCRPTSATAAPVIVFFYGGGWRSGSKRTYRYVAKALARRGYVAVLPDYRIYPQARYPDFLDDGAQAVRWVKDNVQRFGGDPQKIFLMGHSAGAHIAAMLAIDATWLQKVASAPGRDICRPDRHLRSVRFPAAQGGNTQDHFRRRPAGNAADLPRHAGRAAGAAVDRRQGRRGRRRQFHPSRRTAARRRQRGDGGDLSARRALHHRRRDRADHPLAGADFARYRRLHRQGAQRRPRAQAGVP